MARAMTVLELITELELVEDKSQPVQAEGCDCINPVKGIDEDALPGTVLLEVYL
jgi:hypothetical protein